MFWDCLYEMLGFVLFVSNFIEIFMDEEVNKEIFDYVVNCIC